MDREQVFSSVVAARPGRDDVLYLERRGADYSWRLLAPQTPMISEAGESLPDVWIYYTGVWPLDDPVRLREFYDDLLAEMESMAGGDRCRWELDDPWPHWH